MTTVSLSKISYPDPKEHLTILDVVSNTGDATYTAYGWADKAWKVVGKTHFENTYETALVWNGSQFVSLAESNSKSP